VHVTHQMYLIYTACNRLLLSTDIKSLLTYFLTYLQSPLCGADTARKRAWWCLSDILAFKLAKSAAMENLSHSCCLEDNEPTGGRAPDWPWAVVHWTNMLSKVESIEASHLNGIVSWRSRVPAAEVKKTEGASDDTRRTPRTPFVTGRLACIHWTSVRSVLVMVQTHSLSRSSNFCKAACPLHGVAATCA